MERAATWFGIALLLVACSDRESEKGAPDAVASSIAPAPGAEAIQPLLPKDTAFLVRIESTSRLKSAIERFARDTGRPLPPEPMNLVASLLGFDDARIAEDQPVFVAFGREVRPQGALPMTLIAPTADAAGAAASVAQGKTRTSGSHCAVSEDPGYEGGGAPAMKGIPGGLFSARCDWAGLRERYGAEIDAAFAQANEMFALLGSDPKQAQGADFIESFLDGVQALARSTLAIDLSLNERAGNFDLQLALATDDETMRAAPTGKRTSLSELGGSLPDDMGMYAMFHANLAELSKMSAAQYEEIYAHLPADQRTKLMQYMERMTALNEMLHDSWAMAFDFRESGMRGCMVGTAADAAGYMRAYGELLQDAALQSMGMEFAKGEPRKIGDVTVLTFRAKIDATTLLAATGNDLLGDDTTQTVIDSFLGEKGMLVETAVRGDRLYFGFGNTSMMDGMLRATKTPTWITEENAVVGGEPALMIRVDAARLMRGVARLFRRASPDSAAPPLPKGGPTPITLSAFIDGTVYRIHARANPGRLMGLVRRE